MSADAYRDYLERRRQVLEGLSPEQRDVLEEARALILAGLEQVRAQLDLVDHVTYKRMKELADRVAFSQYDFTLADTYLVGAWMMASARTQSPAADPLTKDDLPRPGDFT